MSKSLAIEERIAYCPAGSTTFSGAPIGSGGRDEIVFYIIGTGTTSGGTVVIEEASGAPFGAIYAGTWSAIGNSIAASTFTGGATVAVHLPIAAYRFVRARISSTITGGGSVQIDAVLY
jgi:hypothetical protein